MDILTSVIGIIGVLVGAIITSVFNVLQRLHDNKKNALAFYWYLHAQLRQLNLFIEDTQRNTQYCRVHPPMGRFIAGAEENLFFFEKIIYVQRYLDKKQIEMLVEYFRFVASIDYLEEKINEMKRDKDKISDYTKTYDEVFVPIVKKLNDKIEKQINPLMICLWKKLENSAKKQALQ